MSDTIALDIKISIDRLKDVLNTLDKRENIVEFNLEGDTLFVDTEEDFYSFDICEFIDIVSINDSPYQEDECGFCEECDGYFLDDEAIPDSENNYISKTFDNENDYYGYIIDKFNDSMNISILCDSVDLEILEDSIQAMIDDGEFSEVYIRENSDSDLYYISKNQDSQLYIEPAESDNGKILSNDNNITIITQGALSDCDIEYVLDKIYSYDETIFVELEDYLED